jgi:glyceraldehyde 3-phosphate dehydrogenase
MVKVAINGFGRIGRQVISAMVEKGSGQGARVVAVVDVSTDADYFAYQLKYDSVHGRFKGEVSTEKSKPELKENDVLVVNGHKIRASRRPDLSLLPWKAMGVDYRDRVDGPVHRGDQARGHLAAGAKKVIISAPGKGVT